MLVHKEFAARTYSAHMHALTALVKNLVKKTRANGFESVFFFLNVVPATITEVVVEMMRAQLLVEF